MSLNPFLHPKNPYKKRPNFKEMAIKDSDFRKVVKQELSGKVSLDFRDREAVRVLTQTLLKLDFNLNVDIPSGTLVPTLPLRFNYLLWIQDLIKLNDLNDNILGFDIGVGASCIYPILAANYFHWTMNGSEVNEDNFRTAQKNISTNKLENQIKLSHLKENDKFFEHIFDGDTEITFTMTNPPFYDEHHETSWSSDHKEGELEEDSVIAAAGQSHEMNTKGGEVEFIRSIYEESKSLVNKVKFFTCMVGHKSSLKALKKFFHEEQDEQHIKMRFESTEFCQGKTMRWGIVWTFNMDIKLEVVSLIKHRQDEKKKHAPFEFVLTQLGPDRKIANCKVLYHQLHSWMDTICVKVKEGKVEDDKCSFTLKSHFDKWKNQRRKRREHKRLEANNDHSDEDNHEKEKRMRHEEEPMETEMADSKQPLQICARFIGHKLENEDKVVFSVTFIDGKAGKDGAHQLVQFIKNKTMAL